MIRTLLPSDSDAYRALRQLALDLEPESFATGAEDWRRASEEQVQALLRRTPDGAVLGAFHEHALVGVIGFKRERKAGVSHKATIWGFFVHPEHRRGRIGRTLVEHLIGSARENAAIDYLRCLVTTSNVAATHIAEATGFVRYGLEEAGIKVGSDYFDQAYYRLDIRA